MPSDAIRTPKNNKPSVLRDFMRRVFAAVVGGCWIQSGWPCRTCFFSTMEQLGITGDEAHALWLIQLRMRNDGSRIEDLYEIKVVKKG
jgi:hypothetical protein